MGKLGVFSSFVVLSLGCFTVLDYLPIDLEKVWTVRVLKCLRCFTACCCSRVISYSLPLSPFIGLSIFAYYGLSGTSIVRNIRRKISGAAKEETRRARECIQNILNHYNGIERVTVELNREDSSQDARDIKNIRIIMSKSDICIDEIVNVLLGPDDMKEEGQGELRRKTPARPHI